MNPRRLVTPAIALVATAAFLAVPFAHPTRAATAPASQEHEGETKLEEIMEGVRESMKRLGKEIDAKDQAAAWKTVCALQRHLLDAKQETPAKAASIAEAERPAFVSAFRSRISELLKASCDVETAVLAGKLAEAGKVVKDVMWPMQKPSHKEFRND